MPPGRRCSHRDRRKVGERDADLLRRAVGLAGQAHDAAHRLYEAVIARPRRVGASLAEASDRAIDQTWKAPFQLFIAEPILGKGADLEILDQHVALRNQAERDCLSSGLAMSRVTERLLRLAPMK